MLDFDKTLKIVDFGLSNIYDPPDGELKTACGSPCYAAPEMIAGKKYRGLLTDIWSSGVVLYAMVCGFLPFEDPKTSNLYKKILAGDFKIPKFLSTDCSHFISKILQVDPANRYGIDEIRAHPWYKQFKDKQPIGMFPGKEVMPLNDTLYEQILDEFCFDPDYTVKCIEANRHNNITATYHLLFKKAVRQNKPYVHVGNGGGSLDRNLAGNAGESSAARKAAERRKTSEANDSRYHKRGTSTNQHYKNQNTLQSVNGGDEKPSLTQDPIATITA